VVIVIYPLSLFQSLLQLEKPVHQSYKQSQPMLDKGVFKNTIAIKLDVNI